MKAHTVKILEVNPISHNVRQFKVQKPEGFSFVPGQATDVAINKPGWEDNKHPFTFTGLNSWQHLEFTTKIYPERKGVTAELANLKKGDELIIHEPFGTISYKWPGYFFAGGAGVTPFIAIFRQLHTEDKAANNILYFSNKTVKDIFLKEELTEMLGLNAHFVITDEPGSHYMNTRIDEKFLKEHITDKDKYVYVCGPDDMVANIRKALAEMGLKDDQIIYER